MTVERGGLAQSVQARLARHAKEIDADPNLVLTRYAIERFLYRLSRSPYGEQFVLKGALLLLVWLGETLRPTRDADMLGFGDMSDEVLGQIFRDVCGLEVEPDAMTFLPDTVVVEAIREGMPMVAAASRCRLASVRRAFAYKSTSALVTPSRPRRSGWNVPVFLVSRGRACARIRVHPPDIQRCSRRPTG